MLMMHSQANPSNPAPWSDTLVRISELPLVGNRLLQSQVAQMSVKFLKQILDQKASNLVVIDVRYKSEYDLAHIKGAVLVPYPEIQNGKGIAKIKQILESKRQENLGKKPQVVVICKAGVRSARAVVLLKQSGIVSTNITGGIQAWSQEIDKSIPQYSIKDIFEFQPTLALQRKMRQLWLTGGGLAVASLTVATVFAANQSPNLNELHLQAGVGSEQTLRVSKF